MDSQSTNGEGYFKGNIEARVRGLESDVTEIKTNHLPHIQAGVDKVHEKIDRFQWWLVLVLGGIVANFILNLKS